MIAEEAQVEGVGQEPAKVTAAGVGEKKGKMNLLRQLLFLIFMTRMEILISVNAQIILIM